MIVNAKKRLKSHILSYIRLRKSTGGIILFTYENNIKKRSSECIFILHIKL